MGQILPPLSEWDEVKLCVSFPLLAALLGSSSTVLKTFDHETTDNLNSMTPYLAQFCIGSDYDSFSRSAAASCLFSILLQNTDDADSCVKLLMNDVVLSALVDSIDVLRNDLVDVLTPKAAGGLPQSSNYSSFTGFSRVEGQLNFMGMMVSIFFVFTAFLSNFFAFIYLFCSRIAEYF